jgi:hypothetical protein
MVMDRSAYFKGQFITHDAVPASSPQAALLEQVKIAADKLQQAKPFLDKAAEHIAAYAAHHGLELKMPPTDFEQHRRELINQLLLCGYI